MDLIVAVITLLMMRTKFLGGLAIADVDLHKIVITQKNNKPLGLEKIFEQTVPQCDKQQIQYHKFHHEQIIVNRASSVPFNGKFLTENLRIKIERNAIVEEC